MIVDTSALIAALAVDQPGHEECAAILNRDVPLATSPLVLAELDYLLTETAGSTASVLAIRELAQAGVELTHSSWAEILQAMDLVSQYGDLNISLTDASLVVLAKRHNTNEIITLDQRFRAIRGLDGRHFKLLPFDSE